VGGEIFFYFTVVDAKKGTALSPPNGQNFHGLLEGWAGWSITQAPDLVGLSPKRSVTSVVMDEEMEGRNMTITWKQVMTAKSLIIRTTKDIKAGDKGTVFSTTKKGINTPEHCFVWKKRTIYAKLKR